jgi:hypothetical protein
MNARPRKREKRVFASEEERKAWLLKRAEQKRASYLRNREKELERQRVRKGEPGSEKRERYLSYFRVRYHQGEKFSRRDRQRERYFENLEESRRYHREWKWTRREEVNRRRRLRRSLRAGMSEESARMKEAALAADRMRRMEAWLGKQEMKAVMAKNPMTPRMRKMVKMLEAAQKLSEFQFKI